MVLVISILFSSQNFCYICLSLVYLQRYLMFAPYAAWHILRIIIISILAYRTKSATRNNEKDSVVWYTFIGDVNARLLPRLNPARMLFFTKFQIKFGRYMVLMGLGALIYFLNLISVHLAVLFAASFIQKPKSQQCAPAIQ